MFSITSINKNNRALFESYLEGHEYSLALGLLESGQPCGVIAGRTSDRVFEIKQLYVEEKYRHRGGALELTLAAGDLAGECGARAMEASWNYFVKDGQEDCLEGFFTAMGCEVDEDNKGYYEVSLGELRQNRHIKAGARAADCYRVADRPREYEAYIRNHEKHGEILLERSEYASLAQQNSTVCIRKGEVCGALLVTKARDIYTVRNIYIDREVKAATAVSAIMGMMCRAVQTLEKAPDDTKVIMQPVSNKGEELMELLLGQEVRPVTKRAYMEY